MDGCICNSIKQIRSAKNSNTLMLDSNHCVFFLFLFFREEEAEEEEEEEDAEEGKSPHSTPNSITIWHTIRVAEEYASDGKYIHTASITPCTSSLRRSIATQYYHDVANNNNSNNNSCSSCNNNTKKKNQ